MRLPFVRFRLYQLLISISFLAVCLAISKRVVIPEWAAASILGCLPPAVNFTLGATLVSAIALLILKALPNSLRPRLLGPLVLLALVALVYWTSAMTARGERYQAIAQFHRDRTPHIELVSLVDPKAIRSMQRAWTGQSPARNAWHAQMWRKYERAARYPWLLVAPDPPAPP